MSLKASGHPSDLIAVSVPKAMARPGSHFRFTLPAQAVPGAAQGATAQVTLADGRALPSWLRFAPQSRAFTATSVPAGALPVQAVMTVGDVRVPLVITERNQ
ncbi:putative Ig domain-containing protein [Cupriavidus basilensis]|uniref:Ig domain-containing protein n=1 Tax=Cupriavidus basilensis TaxID=68895 RepID=A0ABT6AJW8_9BURK|nr:putative Ig domain-containing protein [Cupriavidus basilensis]MDF3832749.1 putative Ig domain-containing protein [Cupriavidus basilensis]